MDLNFFFDRHVFHVPATHPYFVFAASLIFGALWRRWEGMAMTGFFAHRWVKLIVAVLLGDVLAYYWSGQVLTAFMAAIIVMAGWTDGVHFEDKDGRILWAEIVPRYTIVSFTIALGGVLALRGSPWSGLYFVIGLASPVGYEIGKWMVRRGWITCWSCVGELWLGATFYGGMVFLR